MESTFEIAKKAILSLSKQLHPDVLTIEGSHPRIKPTAIVCCGMGGSGISGDILKNLTKYAGIHIPIITHKNYGIPDIEGAIYLFISFSGETAETLEAFETALKTRPKSFLAVATGGGKLLEKARKNRVFRSFFDGKNLTPREGIGYTTNAVFSLLCSFIPTVRDIRPLLFSSIPHGQYAAFARRLARDMSRRDIIIYTDSAFMSVGKAWKMYLNESAKKIAFVSLLPETNHNEIEALIRKNTNRYTAVFLENSDAEKVMVKRFAETRAIAKKAGMKILRIPLSGKNSVEKIGRGIALGAWIGYTLAEKEKINPRSTPIITSFKRRIGK